MRQFLSEIATSLQVDTWHAVQPLERSWHAWSEHHANPTLGYTAAMYIHTHMQASACCSLRACQQAAWHVKKQHVRRANNVTSAVSSLEHLLLHQLCAPIRAACMQGAVLCKGHLLCHTIHCAAAAEHNLQDNTAHAQMHARPEHSISYNPLQLTDMLVPTPSVQATV